MSHEAQATNPQTIAAGSVLFPAADKARPRTRSLLQQCWQCLCIAALGVVSYFVISHFFLQSVTVVGVSMAPTLADSRNYLLNRWVYYLHPPQRTDIVVLRDPLDRSFAVKRVIAVAGDSVFVSKGKVYVNGHMLDEPYLKPGTSTFSAPPAKEQLFQCGKDQYFVMGDNRNNSLDSRTYGPVGRANILGMIIR